MPEKSGNGPATLTSGAERGQAGGRRSSAHAGAATVRTAEAVAGAAQLACVLEVSAEKPGNITPSHDFHDTTYEDMLRSAIAVGPELARAGERGVGDTVLAVVQASRRAAPANTNLGIALLLAPLAKAALAGGPLRERLGGDAGCARRGRRARRVRGDPARRRRRAATSASSTTCAPSRRWACARPWRAPPGATRSPSEYVSDFALTFETGVPALVAALGDGLG